MASPGQELLYCSVKNQLQSPQDAIITTLHWSLVSNGHKCIGLGEMTSDRDSQTELLPTGWNENQDLYVLRYRREGEPSTVYMLKVIRIDSDMLVNFMNVSNECVVTLNIRTRDFTTGDLTSFESAFQNLDVLCSQFKREILDAVLKGGKKGGSTSSLTDTSRSSQEKRSQGRSRSYEEEYDPLRIPSRHPHMQQRPPDWSDPGDPFSIGRADLDPLGRGGGMRFDPFRGNRPGMRPDPNAGLPHPLPPGAIPPGARFDPFGPPGGPGQRPGPDPDHELPPGYGDMFM
ncbi:proteasome inhibitor PI31 subunit-like [Mizuhopecten yessoensis]|uniref:proteasome inhibitor PI31 subunit-like n=1 Tax=Mizuhopecten yessoensis TaxID=6573 RepID=UPI000B457739|nr:proteasome inhibitor PI31 subunit-like [Mizuhopecten yessoensis]